MDFKRSCARALQIKVGDVPILVEFEEKALFDRTEKVYLRFKSKIKPLYRIDIRSTGYFRKSKKLRNKVISSFRKDVYKINCSEFRAQLDLKNKTGWIRLDPVSSSEVITSALANLCMFILLKQGAMLFHACGVIKDKRAFIFSGPSGAGKSTVAKLSSNLAILSEELLGISYSGKHFKVFPLPYAGDAVFSRQSARPFPLAAVFRLVKDRSNFLEAVSKARSSVDLLILPAQLDKFISFDGYFRTFHRLIRVTPCYNLHFRPDPSFWRCIDDEFN
ncbi:MAG: hypothetical protein NTY14_03290 [Candidatus Omnitrophica bacterium]|nr:hypothetical protein [Candidatus Omnitrophota bacterium]